MKNKQLFDKTVNILVNAYQKNTLIHGDCSACAVGNIIAANAGITDNNDLDEWRKVFGVDRRNNPLLWSYVFNTFTDTKYQKFEEALYIHDEKTRNQIDLTGYSLRELAKIEFSFETAHEGISDDEYMFNGLMAVIDVLMDIHQATEVQATQAKQLFVKETV